MASYYPDFPGIYKWAKGFKNIEFVDLRYLGALVTKYTWIPAALTEPYRKKANFLWSEFVGFDVDNTHGEPYTLEQAISDWSDSACVIGVTRSHQKEKVTEGAVYPAADRFRIITQWETRIESISEYEYNTKLIVKNNEPFDKACVDATHAFYPCAKIVFANFDGFKQPVAKKPEITKEQADYAAVFKDVKNNGIPPHITKFLEKGIVFAGSRNKSVYVTSLTLLENGMDEKKILALLEKSPFSRQDFSESELISTINSAVKSFTEN